MRLGSLPSGAAVILGAYCLTNLEGAALALGLNAAYSIAPFFNYLESKEGKGDGRES